MKKRLFILIGFFSVFFSSAQTTVKGSVNDADTYEPIPDVSISIEGTALFANTDVLGAFIFISNVPKGEYFLIVSKIGYLTQRYPIVINEGATVDISDMILKIDVDDAVNMSIITLSDDELSNDTNGADNISGLLQASKDVFLRTAAFEFGSSFFRVRGLDSEHGKVLINGIEMNKMFNGRPQWSNWGGLNDVMRNQELSNGLTPSFYHFGGLLGITNTNTRASSYRRGGRITYSLSNRSYTNRLMASYASGLVKDGWAYSISLGRRWGNEGYQNATLYDSNSFFASVEKLINEEHSLNFTAIYAPNRRGKSSPNTQEIYDLKDIKYNEYWGEQDGEKRNSRIKETEEPIVMLNHNWAINSRTLLNTNIAYQFGKLGNSRLDYNGTDLINGFPEGGGANPSPAYYQKLPSYALREFPQNLGIAYGLQHQFIDDGQIDWGHLYHANITNAQNGGNAIYALYQDRVDDTQLTINSIFNTQLKNNIWINASVDFKSLKSENFAQVIDLLGASTYLDIDGYANQIDEAQNDLLNPNRIVGIGDKFKYHYNLFANVINLYAQADFQYKTVDFFIAGNLVSTTYQREGLYKNGGFPETSLGKGKQLRFTGIGVKVGLMYKFTGKHLLGINAGYITRAPSLRNTFSNSRENHNVVPNISEEKLMSTDINYIYRSSLIKGRFSGYYTKVEDANEISFYFADGVGGDNAVFVQEILQGVAKQHIGVELGVEVHITPLIVLKGVASIGQFTYDNNPNLFLSTEPDEDAIEAGFINGFKDYGKTNLKNYKQAVGPHRAYALGFEYRDPDYWWFGATANFFTNTYIDINPLTRSSNFTTNFDGNPFNDYDEALARELLKQEQFDDYLVVNLVGGKSWKIGEYFVGVFASVNNLLNQEYKTGGFEQGRNANYRQLKEDKALDIPVFGSKYWYGRGATYFLNVNVRF